jgi:NadR type nicotinamide-nucleotide adenylyltransferase
MTKRVAIFGPESTGKTTLAASLACHFGEPWAPEYVRQFWEEHGGVITAADLDLVARSQIAAEEEAIARGRRVVFCDTELLTCTLWDDLLFPGACPAWVRLEADRRARAFDLYLLCATDLPFEPDPQRCFPDAESRSLCMNLWRDALVRRAIPFIEIRGAEEARLASAIEAVNDILAPAPLR